MDVTITARRCTVPAPVRDHAQRRMRQLERFHPRPTSASVIFERDGVQPTCEARMMIGGGAPLVASAHGSSFRSALEGALDRLERQLKRQRKRRIRRRANVQRATL